MLRYPSSLDMTYMLEKIKDLPTTVDEGNVLMAYVQGKQIDENIDPYVRKAIEEIEIITGLQAVSIMINTLQAKQMSPIHTDPGNHIRFHLPIQTNKDAVWWDRERGNRHFSLGFWYGPIPYNIEHQVANMGDTDRIHLIVDLKGTT